MDDIWKLLPNNIVYYHILPKLSIDIKLAFNVKPNQISKKTIFDFEIMFNSILKPSIYYYCFDVNHFEYLSICKFCNNVFSHRNSRWKHEQKCQIKSNNDEIMELKKKLKDIEDKINNTQQCSTSIINNNNNTNTNTINNKGTINNNYIIAFGKEDIGNILTEKEKYRILNARYKSLEESIKAIHFNKDRPEYQNIVITNMRDNLIHIFDGEKFISQAKHGTLNQLMDNHMVSIEESLENNKENLNPKTVDVIEKLIEKINNETTELYDEENDKKYLNYKNYKNDLIKLVIYNESDKKKPSVSIINKKKKQNIMN
jgi:hypothetical protein